MKIYALKHKDEIVELAVNEWQLADSYKFDNSGLKDNLKIVSGEFTEDEISK